MSNANPTANVEVGIAGSITMTLLVIAVALLLTSFYRRYKRASEKRNDEK